MYGVEMNQINQLIIKYKGFQKRGIKNLETLNEGSNKYRRQKNINTIWQIIVKDLIILAEQLKDDTKN